MKAVWLDGVVDFYRNPVLNANSVTPDLMPRSAASDLGILCLLMSLFKGLYT